MNMPKKKAIQFVRKYNLKASTLTRETIRDILKRQGFILFRHNKFGCSSDKVDAVLKSLRLTEYAQGKDSFVYVSSTDKSVFVCSQIGEDAELYLLLHEAGHITCNHPVQHGVLAYNDVFCEQEANAFAFYVLQYVKRRKLARLASAACTLLLAAGIGFAANAYAHMPAPTTPSQIVFSPTPTQTVSSVSTAESAGAPSVSLDMLSPADAAAHKAIVYVAKTGTVYHKENCSYITGRNGLREMTIASAEELALPPCSRCRPDIVQ